MINKVQPNVPAGYTNSINQAEGKQAGAALPPRPVNNASAEVSLSEDALALQRITQAVKDSPDVRDNVVRAIKSQIEAGTYRVDADSLAGRLLPFFTRN
jgi:flagellar biosynthesis anti-sigma factor FlgM